MLEKILTNILQNPYKGYKGVSAPDTMFKTTNKTQPIDAIASLALNFK